MVTVEQLYGELWADENGLETELATSLDPRPVTSLYEAFAALSPKPGELVVDVGCRDARHAIELVQRHEVRVLGVDPVPHHVDLARRRVEDAGLGGEITVTRAGMESLPLADESAAFVWCRDVTSHVDLPAGLAECRRVLHPGRRILLYQTFATDLLEPSEAARLFAATAVAPENMRQSFFEDTVLQTGLEVESVDTLGSEWREAMIEGGRWDPAADLLAIARLRRREPELAERYGRAKVEADLGSRVWGIYQLLGKLRPTVYVLRRPDR